VCPICGPSIKSVKWYIDKIGDDTLYSNGQQIACVRCPAGGPLGGEQGICVFTQKMGDRKIKGSVVKSKINDLIRHGCDGCGSCPVDPGNNVDNGEVTVNYVSSACGTRVC
jgi:hypothetical protein